MRRGIFTCRTGRYGTCQGSAELFTPDYVERVGKRIDEAIQALEKKYHLE